METLESEPNIHVLVFLFIITLLLPIVLLLASVTIGPNVAPSSLDALNTGSLVRSLSFISHHDTYTFLPSAPIDGSTESTLVELLRLILGPNEFPPSVDALNIISKFSVVLLLDQVMYTLFRDVAIGAKNRGV
jgi:hypothetical protein